MTLASLGTAEYDIYAGRAVATVCAAEMFGPELRLQKEARILQEQPAGHPDETRIYPLCDMDLTAEQEWNTRGLAKHAKSEFGGV